MFFETILAIYMIFSYLRHFLKCKLLFRNISKKENETFYFEQMAKIFIFNKKKDQAFMLDPSWVTAFSRLLGRRRRAQASRGRRAWWSCHAGCLSGP